VDATGSTTAFKVTSTEIADLVLDDDVVGEDDDVDAADFTTASRLPFTEVDLMLDSIETSSDGRETHSVDDDVTDMGADDDVDGHTTGVTFSVEADVDDVTVSFFFGRPTARFFAGGG